MKQTSLYLPCLVLIALLITGCESNGIANRINEKSAAFSTLNPEDKAYLEEGIIFPGYTEDMTYIALGKPSSIETNQKDDTTVEIWTYKKLYPSDKFEAILLNYIRTRNPDLYSTPDDNSSEVMSSDNSSRVDPTSNRYYGKNTMGNSSQGMGSLHLPDVPVYNLILFFTDNKIVDVQLESLDGTKF